MKIILNDRVKEIDLNTSIAQLLKGEKIKAPSLIIVELNSQIVARDKYKTTTLKDGDRINLVPFVCGG
ncbi:sulfur carrier protein ThiS [candidate division NPL-UPA2 bacterium]|nr:sulfur carrier protein ThiS [candidate division NPL-UPA2 bacterium]